MRRHMARCLVLLTTVVLALASSITAAAQTDARVVEEAVKVEVSSEPSSGEKSKAIQPKLHTAPAAGSRSGPRGPGSFTGGCCSSPTPFPGLDCCDTTDCGWFDCNESATRSIKRYR